MNMPDHGSEPIFGGRRGGVSLTFDDGTANQLAKVVPSLDDRNLCGTFYINPRDSLMAQALDSWKAVAKGGHEIGNHTLSHPCPAAISGTGGLEDMSIREVEADILAAQKRLDTIAPGQSTWTFAYPCYSTYVGRGAERMSYVPVVARHFAAGRAGGELGFANRPGLLDMAALVGMPVERLTATETIDLVSRLTAKGQWVILVFHDINEGVLPFPEYDFLSVLDYLVAAGDSILTAPVAKMADRLTRLDPNVGLLRAQA